jgi:hypothetical protein
VSCNIGTGRAALPLFNHPVATHWKSETLYGPLLLPVKIDTGSPRWVVVMHELSARRIAFSILLSGGARSCGTEVLVL